MRAYHVLRHANVIDHWWKLADTISLETFSPWKKQFVCLYFYFFSEETSWSSEWYVLMNIDHVFVALETDNHTFNHNDREERQAVRSHRTKLRDSRSNQTSVINSFSVTMKRARQLYRKVRLWVKLPRRRRRVQPLQTPSPKVNWQVVRLLS